MSEPPPASPAPDPNGSASCSIADPYPTNDIPVPPSPGAPTAGHDNVMTIYVPTDATTLQMGASSAGPNAGTPAISGFRMSTLNHAHLTAQTPLTTISLGAAGGQGMGGVAGLSIYTAGEKDEHVVGDAKHTFDANREEEVAGNWTGKIEGVWKITCEKNEERETHETKNETHIADSNEFTIGNKYEFVQGTTTDQHIGDAFEYLVGNKTETVEGNILETIHGDFNATVKGTTTESFTGAKAETNLAAMYERTIGLATEIKVGGAIELTLAAALEVFGGLKAEITKGILYEKNSAVKKGDATIEAHHAAIEKDELDLKLDTLKLNLVTLDAQIVSLGTIVYK